MAINSTQSSLQARVLASRSGKAVSAAAGRYDRTILGVLGIVASLVAWQLLADSHLINPLWISKPTAIVGALKTYLTTGGGVAALKMSATEFFVGFALSLVVGLILGFLIGWYKYLDYLLDPLISFGYVVPRIALVPLFVIWFGLGIMSKVAVVFLSAIFPIMFNTISGVKTTDTELLKVARSYKASRLQIFRTVVIPGAMPQIVTGIRLGVGQGLIGMVVGEFFASTIGLGYTIVSAGNNFDTPLVFAAVFLVAIMALVLTGALRLVERRLDRWRPARPQ